MPAHAEKFTSYACGSEEKEIAGAVNENAIYLMHRVEDIQQTLNTASTQQKEIGAIQHLGAVVQFVRMSPYGFPPDFMEYTAKLGFELYNMQVKNRQTIAVYFVPNGDLSPLALDFQKYCSHDCDSSSGDCSDYALIRFIDEIAPATLESFWTDTASLPSECDTPLWWEIWLSNTYGEEAINQVRLAAAEFDIKVASGVLSFPQRSIIYIKASRSVLENALSTLTTIAEIRGCYNQNVHLS